MILLILHFPGWYLLAALGLMLLGLACKLLKPRR